MAVGESDGWQPYPVNIITRHKCNWHRSSSALRECLAKGVVVHDVPQPSIAKRVSPRKGR